jgi:hypothetical protein
LVQEKQKKQKQVFFVESADFYRSRISLIPSDPPRFQGQMTVLNMYLIIAIAILARNQAILRKSAKEG